MDITVVGPGAVGTLLGGLLSLRGHGVSFRCRQAPAGSVAERPVRIVLPDRWALAEGLRFAGPGSELREPGVVFVALGRHHLRGVRRPDFARLVGTRKGVEPEVVFANADPAEPARLGLGQRGKGGGGWSLCLTLLDAVKLQDREVELAGARPTLVVEKGSAGHRLLSGLSGFGISVLPVADPLPCSDSLFVSQLLFLPVAMCNTTLARFLAFPEGRTLARSILGEGLEAMARAGRQLARLPVMDPQDLLARIEKKPDSFAPARTRPDRAYNTVLQSYLRGRPTEAPELNRRIVELASGAGLHLEWNWRVLQKVGRIASLGFYPEPGDLLRSLS
jgi:hypothetical protein